MEVEERKNEIVSGSSSSNKVYSACRYTFVFHLRVIFISKWKSWGGRREKRPQKEPREKDVSGKIECQHNCGLPVGRNITKAKGWNRGWKRRFHSNLSFKLKTGAHASLHPVIFYLHFREILCPFSNPNETKLSLSLCLYFINILSESK